MQLRLREMDDAESQTMRATVNDIVRRSSKRNWFKSLARPYSLAIAWPAVGVILAGVGMFGRGKTIGRPEAQ